MKNIRELKQKEIERYVSNREFATDDLPMYAFEVTENETKEIHIITEKAEIIMFDVTGYVIGTNKARPAQILSYGFEDANEINFILEAAKGNI